MSANLGEEIYINCKESISATIRKRIGIVKKSILEIKSIVEDARSSVPGGILTGLTLWESCVIPFMMNNSSTWMEMKRNDIDKLCKLQNYFLNTLLNTFHCPIPLMHLDLSVLTIPYRLLKDKLVFYHHLTCLPESALANQVLVIQEKFQFPNLCNEIQHFLNKHEIVDVKNYSKKEWKDFVKDRIQWENREFLLESSKRYKKLDYLSLSSEEPGVKEYFKNLDLAGSRIKFKERSGCMTTCKASFLSQNLTSMFCTFCQSKSICNLSHWRRCNGYSKFRISRNLSLDSDIVAYYRDIIDLGKNDGERSK